MKSYAPFLICVLSIMMIGLAAYFTGTFLGAKPFAWEKEPLLESEKILEGMQGMWRNNLNKIGNQVQGLPNDGQGSMVKIDKNRLELLPNFPGAPHLENTFELDTTKNPVWFDLTHTPTKDKWLGVIEINRDKTKIRIQMRRDHSLLGRPTDFNSTSPEDIYNEYSR